MMNNYFGLDRDVPVYLITGFLEAGKTSFIQETLEDKEFDNGQSTLLILCEEGEREADLGKIKSPVTIRVLDDEERLTQKLLEEWQNRFQPERVLVEYNGMWQKRTFYQAMPMGWLIQNEFCFLDARTFMSYNANLRTLVFDKLQNCDLVVFNRFPKGEDVMPYHKIVRAANRGCTIVYEDAQGGIQYDEIVDPLPFDKKAPVIQIEDRDFAFWYQDLGEELPSYDGKTVRLKAQVALPPELREGEVLVGRRMMNCCAADISFVGLVAKDPTIPVGNGDWVDLTAKIQLKRHPMYHHTVGPVLTVREMRPAPPPEEEVASFF